MGLFSRFFAKSKPLAPRSKSAVLRSNLATASGSRDSISGREISFDPQLVVRLKDDHRELLRLFREISAAAQSGEFEDIASKLAEFKLAFQTHIMVENVKFYVYLQQYLANEPDLTTFLAEVRREMDGIARVLVKFVQTYTATPNTVRERSAAFLQELAGIGTVLTKRVQLEESRLYTLYLPK